MHELRRTSIYLSVVINISIKLNTILQLCAIGCSSLELPPNAQGLLNRRKREKTIVKFLLGTDGQVYRGRYKMVAAFFSFLLCSVVILAIKRREMSEVR